MSKAFRPALLAVLPSILFFVACGTPDDADGGVLFDSSTRDGGVDGRGDATARTDAHTTDVGDDDSGPMDGDSGPNDDGGPLDAPDSGAVACSPGFRAVLGLDQATSTAGESFIDWTRSEVDTTQSVSHGRAVRVRTAPGDELLPACSGSTRFAGRSRLPAAIPPGRTVWFRIFQYIPSTFSFGYKYSRNAGDAPDAAECGQPADGNAWLKWLVMAPDDGTARVYFSPTAARRELRRDPPALRLISEALHRAGDFDMDLPRDRWFALQMAVRVSDGDDGFIRAWLDDTYLGEVTGRTAVEGASLVEWGMGDYWNGIPWTDGEAGRTDFWVDEILIASDADGYDEPTGVDEGGRPYIPSCMRVADVTLD